MTPEATDSDLEQVALFPLNLVLFPGGLLPLRIFEPRYQRMVSECLRRDEAFAVAAIVDGPEAGGVAITARIGTLARIVDWEQMEDGLLGLLCEGDQSVVLGDISVEEDRLLRAEIRRLPLTEPHPLPDDLAWLGGLLDELLQRIGPPFDRLRMARPGADHVANRLTELLPLPIAEKQALLELGDGLVRLRRLAGMVQPAGDR
ncbi:MAG: LON peptidase substrate-binding domain-containing protein [Deltaproteobacteria bacterium]|jgi:Lon protease-like protein|nr:LON peptidase substrate-binding domain-containing protein [Deltaproteobacteria bacterium]